MYEKKEIGERRLGDDKATYHFNSIKKEIVLAVALLLPCRQTYCSYTVTIMT